MIFKTRKLLQAYWWVPLAAAGATQLTSIMSNALFGGGSSGPSHEGSVNLMQAQSNINKEHKMWAAKNLNRMAEAAGVSPLAMLGQGLAYSGPAAVQQGGRDRNTAFDGMGQAVGEALTELMREKSGEAELDRKMKGIQVDAAQLELDMLKRKVDEDKKGITQHIEGQGDTIDVPAQVTPHTQGIVEGKQGASNVYEFGNQAVEMPAQALTDLVSEDALAKMDWYGYRIKNAGTDYANSYKARRGHEKSLMEMRKRQQLLSRRLPQGWEYRYQPRKGWYKTKIGNEGSKLWRNYKIRRKQSLAPPDNETRVHKKSRSSYKWGRVKEQYRATHFYRGKVPKY